MRLEIVSEGSNPSLSDGKIIMQWLYKLYIKFINSSTWHHLYYKHTKEFKKMISNVEKNALEFRKKCEELETYPCQYCLELGNKVCIKTCDLIEHDNEVLTALINKNKCCPDCGNKNSLCKGPEAGASQNIYCTNCNHWFNFCLGTFTHRIIK